jgi:hypothetical protein
MLESWLSREVGDISTHRLVYGSRWKLDTG